MTDNTQALVEDLGLCIGCNKPLRVGEVVTPWADEVGHYDCRRPACLNRIPELDSDKDTPPPMVLLGSPARYVPLEAITAWNTRIASQSERESVLEEAAKVAGTRYARHGSELGTVRARHYEHAGKQIAGAIRALKTTPTPPPSTDKDARVATLFDAIQHGDAEHREWLRQAIDAHFAGEPVPEPRGKGRKEARIAVLEGALEFIADSPDPGEEKERSATFYRIHAAMLKQAAAKALGRQTVSDEAMQWAEEWWNSAEGIAARSTLQGDGE